MPSQPTRDPANPQLRDALRDYAKMAITLLAARRPIERPTVIERKKWRANGRGMFVMEPAEGLEWHLSLLRHQEMLHALPEYGRAIAQLELDELIGPQLGQLVGTPLSSSRLDKDWLVDDIVHDVIRNSDLVYDEERFHRAYLLREQELHAAACEVVTLAPVVGLAEAPSVTFGDVVLDVMTDHEACTLLETGILRQPFGSSSVVFANTEYVLRARKELPKVVGNSSPEAQNNAMALLTKANDDFHQVLISLRMLKDDSVALPGIVTVFGKGTHSWGPLGGGGEYIHPTYKLKGSEAQEAVTIWKQLGSDAVRRRSFLDIAARRISYASERHRVEDRFVDLMIAAEAMFLGERRKGETGGELTYKLATRFAILTDIPNTTRRQRFDHMRRAYAARSGIVHGDRPKGLEDEGALSTFARQTGTYLRLALRKLMVEAELHPERQVLIDWDDLIFGQ